MCQALEHLFQTPWNIIKSVNVPPIQLYDKENDGAIKSQVQELQYFSLMSMVDS